MCEILDKSEMEYCPKNELEAELLANEVAKDYIEAYCKCHDDCDKCWSDLGEKLLEGEFDESNKTS